MATKSSKSTVRDIDDVPTNSNENNRRKPTDVIEIFQLPDGKYAKLRPIGGVASVAGHWVKTVKKDGSKGNFYMGCAAWDPQANQRTGGNGSSHCAFCRYEANEKAAGTDQELILSRFSQDYFHNAIHRVKQRAGRPDGAGKATPEERKSGFKDKDSETWTPVVAVRVTTTVIRHYKELKQLNTHDDEESGETKAYSVFDADFGCDVAILKDKSKPAAQMYSVQKQDHKPLTEAEQKYLTWDLSELAEYPTTEEVETEFAKWATKMKVKSSKKKSSEDDEEDEDEAPKKKSSAKKKVEDFDEEDDDDEPPKKATKKKVVADYDDDDEDEDEDEDEPVVKKKPASKKKVEDFDEDDEDDDSPPPKKKPAAKKKVDDFDEDDEEDEDEDPPPKKKVAKKKPVDDDFDDEVDDTPKKTTKKKVVDDFDEDDEDDDPPPKKKPAPKKKVVDDEEDEDEDDDPPPKKTVKKTTKKKVVDDDDDEEDDGL